MSKTNIIDLIFWNYIHTCNSFDVTPKNVCTECFMAKCI